MSSVKVFGIKTHIREWGSFKLVLRDYDYAVRETSSIFFFLRQGLNLGDQGSLS